jgi:4-hydroxybenzoate polyprenyltransferase
MKSFVPLLRPNRSIMVAMITGSAAFAAGAGVGISLLMTLAGWCLAVGGFSLDLYADRDLDKDGVRAKLRQNPITSGHVSLRTGLAFSVTFIIISLLFMIFINPLGLIPWTTILLIIIGLARHVFEAPLMRAFTLGALQALYLIMGASAGQMHPGHWLLAGMFFFAMFGGRGMIDIRDYPLDMETRVSTLPKKYGVQKTALFTLICLIIAFALSLAAYFTGEFNRVYLYLDLLFIFIGLICAILFAARPTPRLAWQLTLVFMVGSGSLMCLAMILGSL